MNRIFLVRELEKDQEPFAVCAELFVSITNIYLTVVSPLVVKVGLDAFWISYLIVSRLTDQASYPEQKSADARKNQQSEFGSGAGKPALPPINSQRKTEFPPKIMAYH